MIGAGLLAGCGRPTETPKIAAASGSTRTPSLMSGIDSQYINDTVRAQDDFYQYVNGKWLASTEMPADKSSYDPWDELTDETQVQLRGEMTPQTLNAYYEPERNEIVFPAAILHPPSFNFNADDAVNYGAIGGVIGLPRLPPGGKCASGRWHRTKAAVRFLPFGVQSNASSGAGHVGVAATTGLGLRVRRRLG
jgi:hypothetical protein